MNAVFASSANAEVKTSETVSFQLQEETLALERDPYNFQFNVLADSPSWVVSRLCVHWHWYLYSWMSCRIHLSELHHTQAHKREHNRDVITEARNRPAPSFEVSAAYKSVIRYQAAKARAGKEQLE